MDTDLVVNCTTADPSRRGERGKFSRPATFGGGALTLKNTEKGVPDGFFLTSYMHKIHLWSGLCPDPARGATLLPKTSSHMVRGQWDTPPHVFIAIQLLVNSRRLEQTHRPGQILGLAGLAFGRSGRRVIIHYTISRVSVYRVS